MAGDNIEMQSQDRKTSQHPAVTMMMMISQLWSKSQIRKNQTLMKVMTRVPKNQQKKL